MIKVISDLGYNRKKEEVDVRTRVFIGAYNVDEGYRDELIKAELKCLITLLVKKHPDLLFSALEEVIGEGLHHD